MHPHRTARDAGDTVNLDVGPGSRGPLRRGHHSPQPDLAVACDITLLP